MRTAHRITHGISTLGSRVLGLERRVDIKHVHYDWQERGDVLLRLRMESGEVMPGQEEVAKLGIVSGDFVCFVCIFLRASLDTTEKRISYEQKSFKCSRRYRNSIAWTNLIVTRERERETEPANIIRLAI